MRCPNCGAECTTDTCTLCGTALRFRKNNIRKIFATLAHNKVLNFMFPLSSIIFLVMVGFLFANSTVNGIPMKFSEWPLYMLITFTFIVLPYDIIRWKKWGKNKYLKKVATRLDIYKKVQTLISKANTLADTINVTTDRETFESSLSVLKETFHTLIGYEKYGVFSTSLPSQDLADLLAKESIIRTAFETRSVNESLATQPLKSETQVNYDSLNGHDFEYFCADLLRKNGFSNVEVTRGSGDHGIDILAEKDDITYAIQCKCYSSNIGNAAVQQAHTGKSLYHKNVAVVMTNQYFTQQAKEEATQLGVKLWDRDKINILVENSK